LREAPGAGTGSIISAPEKLKSRMTAAPAPTRSRTARPISGGRAERQGGPLDRRHIRRCAQRPRISAVQVQVLIDENGNVISANAVSGSSPFASGSVAAAHASKFTPYETFRPAGEGQRRNHLQLCGQ